MLIICVQPVESKSSQFLTKTCHKHINQKNEREQKHTDF